MFGTAVRADRCAPGSRALGGYGAAVVAHHEQAFLGGDARLELDLDPGVVVVGVEQADAVVGPPPVDRVGVLAALGGRGIGHLLAFSDTNRYKIDDRRAFGIELTTGLKRPATYRIDVTLDPVHYEGITRLAERIRYDVETSDHRDVAETVWAEFLDPLARDGKRVLEPLDEQRRLVADVEDVALADTEYDTVHGLDAGTINPTTFSNGLVLDIAQAAMSATPSDLDLHRARTVVMTVHSADATVAFDEDDWTMNDEGFVRTQIRQAPRVNRFAEGVVHALSLYRAESEHARINADVVDDLLCLDGPIYPTGLLRWADQHPELATVLEEEEQPKEVVENYVRLVETFVEKAVPLVGFVKNPAGNAITRTVRDTFGQAPWVDDAAMFKRLLERGEMVDDPDDAEGRRRFERDTSALTATSWFVSRGGTDAVPSRHGDVLGVDRRLDPEAYEVTFCVIYDPRTDVLYRLEAPYAVTRSASQRDALQQWALSAVAAERGPPLAVGKADELAKIGGREKASLRETLEETFRSRRARQYDDVRWGDE